MTTPDPHPRARRTYYKDKTKAYYLRPETLTPQQVTLTRLLTYAIELGRRSDVQAYHIAMVLAALQSRARDLQKKYTYRYTGTSIMPPGALEGAIRRVEDQIRAMAATAGATAEFHPGGGPSVTLDGALKLPA